MKRKELLEIINEIKLYTTYLGNIVAKLDTNTMILRQIRKQTEIIYKKLKELEK